MLFRSEFRIRAKLVQRKLRRAAETNSGIEAAESAAQRIGKYTAADDADANGAYNIARKALWIINRFKESSDDELLTVKIGMTQRQWLEFAQSNG